MRRIRETGLTSRSVKTRTLLQLNATDARVTLPRDDTFELETIAGDAGTLRVRGEAAVRATTRAAPGEKTRSQQTAAEEIIKTKEK